MKLYDIPDNEIFTIDETPSYPKLKIGDDGYIDMRDLIKKIPSTNWDNCRILTLQDMQNQFPEIKTQSDIDEWRKYIMDKI